MRTIQRCFVTSIQHVIRRKLILNWKKYTDTKFTCFHTEQRIVAYPELKTNNIIIDRVTEFNFLGLILSSTMKWKKHIDHIVLKFPKSLV